MFGGRGVRKQDVARGGGGVGNMSRGVSINV